MGRPPWLPGQPEHAVYPVDGHRKDDLGHSHYMGTNITLSATGRIDGVTRIWSREAARGFTGGVLVILTDKSGNVLATTKPRKWGVDGVYVPGAPSDRTEYWHEALPREVRHRAAGYAILHTPAPTERWRRFLQDATEAAREIKSLIEEFR